MGELRWAVSMTPTALEGLRFDLPGYPRQPKRDTVTDRCSAFAATGPATRDGKMIIGHVSWWRRTLAGQTNVMLDIQPDTGHVWLIDSRNRTATVYTANEVIPVSDGVLRTRNPDIALALAELF
jgi:hypothetical protein